MHRNSPCVRPERIGLIADRLITGLEKVPWYNRERFGSATNGSSYPNVGALRDLNQVDVHSQALEGPG